MQNFEESALWGEKVRNHIRTITKPQDLAALWRLVVIPSRATADPRIWSFVHWWVHWRMRELAINSGIARLRASIPTGSISGWPDAWWEPLPPLQSKPKGKAV